MDFSKLWKWIGSLFSSPTDNTGNLLAKRGVAAVSADNFEQAIPDLELALELGAANYEIETLYTVLGRAYDGLGRRDESIEAHKLALKHEPNFHKAWNNLGIAYSHKGDLDEAMRCYQEALRIDPEYAYTYGSMGVVYLKQGNPAKAVEVIEKGIALDPSMPILHGNLALALGMAGRFEAAAQALHQATGLGYKNWQEVQRRIENLQALDEHKMGSPSGSTASGQIPLEVERLRISMLPTHCQGCGAMVSLSGVHWVGELEALCPYCGVSLLRPLDD